MGSLSPRRSLYRTLSDESVCSNRKCSSYASSRSSMLDQAMPSDILFSTTPPYHSTLPPRMVHNQAASNLRSKCTSEHNRGGQAQSPSVGILQENRLNFMWCSSGHACMIPRSYGDGKEQNQKLRHERASSADTSERPRQPRLRDALGLSSLFSGASRDSRARLKSHLCPANIISALQQGCST